MDLFVAIVIPGIALTFIAIIVFNSRKKPKKTTPAESFWRRQFRVKPTEAQKRFDLLFGAFLPIACFFYDPFVFKGNHQISFLGEYRALAYLLAAISILSMMAWCLFGERLGRFRPVFSGIFALAATVSLVIGGLMLPISLIGLVVLIGALGFTPFLVVFIYGRAAYRAFPKESSLRPKGLLTAIGSAAFLIFALWSVNSNVVSRINRILEGDVTIVRAETETLRWFRPIVEPTRIGQRSCKIGDSDRKEALAESYRMLKGTKFDCDWFHD